MENVMPGMSNTSGGKIYVGTFDGLFEIRRKNADPGTKQRTTKNNKIINVLTYTDLTGMLKGVEFKKDVEVVKNVKQDFFVITIENSGKIYQLDLMASSSTTFYLMARLAACDPTKPMRLHIFATVEGEKKKTTILLYQNEAQVKGIWSKDNANGCPDLVKHEFKGKVMYDDTARNAFVLDYMQKNIIPKITAPIAASAPESDGPKDDTDEPEYEQGPAPGWLTKGAEGQGAPLPKDVSPGK